MYVDFICAACAGHKAGHGAIHRQRNCATHRLSRTLDDGGLSLVPNGREFLKTEDRRADWRPWIIENAGEAKCSFETDTIADTVGAFP
jgi:hypothetical protein